MTNFFFSHAIRFSRRSLSIILLSFFIGGRAHTSPGTFDFSLLQREAVIIFLFYVKLFSIFFFRKFNNVFLLFPNAAGCNAHTRVHSRSAHGHTHTHPCACMRAFISTETGERGCCLKMSICRLFFLLTIFVFSIHFRN